MIAGVCKRFAVEPPPASFKMLLALRSFVRRRVRELYPPIASDADTTVEYWLSKTNYTQARKDQLLRKWLEVTNIFDPKYSKCKSFQKDECYTDYKHARGINLRTDEFKCAVGPIFKLMEEIVYQDPDFIKHVPVAERPDYIMQRLYIEGGFYLATDYTSFEALFTSILMQVCEFELYSYMVSELPNKDQFMRLLNVMLATNVCQYKYLTVHIEATRMSGEMNTSLGNGFSNKMFMEFVVEMLLKGKLVKNVEGDDGLTVVAAPKMPSTEFQQLGLDIKLEVHRNINEASFCGIVFDSEDRVNVVNPIQLLVEFGWTTRQYAKARPSTRLALLRCKALSYAHQYPGCPIVGALADYGLRVTRGRSQQARDVIRKSKMSSWYIDSVNNAFKDEKKLIGKSKMPPLNTRLLVEKLYGVSVDTQIEIETYLNSLTVLQPLDLPQVMSMAPQSWSDYFEKYSSCVSQKDSYMEYPAQLWPLLTPKEWVLR